MDEVDFCLTILLIGFVLFIIWRIREREKGIREQEKIDQHEKQIQDDLLQVKTKYDIAKNKISIPEGSSIVELVETPSKLNLKRGTKCYIWKDEQQLSFFVSEIDEKNYKLFLDNPIEVITIPIDKIEYFTTKGEIYRENKISGGGGNGGGSSLTGAVIGGAIAGGAGAIIGSRKEVKINEIKSELVTHDERHSFLNYYDSDKKRLTLYFRFVDFSVFNSLIPEKEFSLISSIRSTQIIQSQSAISQNKSITDQIRDLAALKDDGIISEEEFEEKKKILLNKIS